MQKYLWALIVLAALPCLGQQPATDSQGSSSAAQSGGNAATEQQLWKNEKQLWDAWKSKNMQPFEANTATNVPSVTPAGIATIDQMRQDIQQCNVTTYSLADQRADWVGQDVTVLTYKADQDATCKGKKVPATVWAQSVWAKKDGKWVAVSHQEVPQGAGESGSGAAAPPQ